MTLAPPPSQRPLDVAAVWGWRVADFGREGGRGMRRGRWSLGLGESDGGLCASRRAAVVYALVLVPLEALDCGFFVVLWWGARFFFFLACGLDCRLCPTGSCDGCGTFVMCLSQLYAFCLLPVYALSISLCVDVDPCVRTLGNIPTACVSGTPTAGGAHLHIAPSQRACSALTFSFLFRPRITSHSSKQCTDW